jgi:hypothetical protein
MLTQIKDIKDIPKGNDSILQKKPELYNTNYDINKKRT